MALLDTNALIWFALDPQKLSSRAVKAMRQPGNVVSHVSLWELAIKSSLGKLVLRDPSGARVSARQFVLTMGRELGLGLVSLAFDDFDDVETLPFHHRDPFDRLLAVVAHRHQLPIISADAVFEQYGVKRVW